MKHKVPPLRFAPVGMTDLLSEFVGRHTSDSWLRAARPLKGRIYFKEFTISLKRHADTKPESLCDHRNIADTFGAEDAAIAFDFRRGAEGFGVVIGEFYRGLAF